MPKLLVTLATTLALTVPLSAGTAAHATAAPIPEVPKTLIAGNFPDPDVVKINGKWYAYATNTSHHLPTATAPTVDGPWTYVGDAMPGGPDHGWATDGSTWAPDVFPNPDGTITLTYAALNPSINKECIGVAVASSPTGPFVPQGSGPLICQSDLGGSIDANTFLDANGTRWLTWKNDGNRIGLQSTLWVQQTTNNGRTLTGPRYAMLTGNGTEVIEAPDIVQRGGQYTLFFSIGGFGGCGYSTGYATSPQLGGPWTRQSLVFMHQGNTGICGPGGADVVTSADGLGGGDKLFFHGYVGGERYMFSIDLSWNGSGQPVQGGHRAASLDGDGRAEIAEVQTDGSVEAQHNDAGFATMPYGASATIATDADPARTRFADLDDDGKKELVEIQPNGDLVASHNVGGFASMPFSGAVTIGTGFTEPDRVKFADLDDDGRAELIKVESTGQVRAWHNDGAFSAMPYGASTVIAADCTPSLTHFADIDGDGRDELIDLEANGDVFALHNDGGFASMPFGARVLIAGGWTDPTRLKFADLDGDGRDEIFTVESGDVRAWHNDEGFVETPYGDSVVVADDFTDPSRTFLL